MHFNEQIGCAKPCEQVIPDKFLLKNVGVEYHSTVTKFANHKRNKNVGFIAFEEHYKYIDPATMKLRRAKGITKILKGAFYQDYAPTYSPKKKPSKGRGRGKPKTKGLTASQLLAQKIADERVKGIKLGNIVHEELCDWARIPSTEEWSRKHPRPNTYTVKVIRELARLRIEPLYGEWPIYANWGIATGIDIVGASADYGGRLVLIEIKTGYEGYFKRGNKQMTRTPMKRVPNSPQNQAFLQCLIARAMLEKEYGISGVIGLVIRVRMDGVNVYAIPSTFLKRQNTIYRGLKDHVEELEMQRARARRERAAKKKKLQASKKRGRGQGKALTTSPYWRPVKQRPVTSPYWNQVEHRFC